MTAGLDVAFFERARDSVDRAKPWVVRGRVRSLVGNVIEAQGLAVQLGTLCRIEPQGGAPAFDAEVVGFDEDVFRLLPLGEAGAVGPGAPVRIAPEAPEPPPAAACLGRVLDGLGRPLDDGPPPDRGAAVQAPLRRARALARERIHEPLGLGVRAIDTLLTVGRGARVGLFAGSGVGKSTLLGQIARFTQAEVVVVGLVGERGREVREFVERDLGDALERSVVVVSTSDEAPLLRRRAAELATRLAEDFRAEGRHVLLLMDSLTRFCTAQREIGLAAGEPPTTRGYTASVWSVLPKLLERAGTGDGTGSITGIYTVLVEGDDLAEPVADAARALLDGHVVLSREIAESGRFPAIDVLASVSRVMPDVVDAAALARAQRVRELLAAYRRAEDLIAIGAYVSGSDAAVDEARQRYAPLQAFLAQGRDEHETLSASAERLSALLPGGETS